MRSARWVLLVDDDLDACEILADRLRRRGFAVHTAGGGADAIALLDDLLGGQLPSAVVTDLVMPGILGTSLVEFLRSEPRLARIPIAIVTAAPDLAPGGHLVLAKPFELASLLLFLQKHVIDP